MSKLIIFHIFSKGSLLIDDDKSINYGPPTNKKRDRRTELAYEPVISLSNKKPRDLSYGSLLSCSLFSFGRGCGPDRHNGSWFLRTRTSRRSPRPRGRAAIHTSDRKVSAMESKTLLIDSKKLSFTRVAVRPMDGRYGGLWAGSSSFLGAADRPPQRSALPTVGRSRHASRTRPACQEPSKRPLRVTEKKIAIVCPTRRYLLLSDPRPPAH